MKPVNKDRECVMSFSALVTRRLDNGSLDTSVEKLEESALPQGDVLVAIDWAGFNFKIDGRQNAQAVSGQRAGVYSRRKSKPSWASRQRAHRWGRSKKKLKGKIDVRRKR